MDQVFTPQLSPPAPQRGIIHGFHPVCKQIPGQAWAWFSIMSRAFCEFTLSVTLYDKKSISSTLQIEHFNMADVGYNY